MNPSLSSLYELKFKMRDRLNAFKKNNPNTPTKELDEMIELLNRGIESAEFYRLKAEWTKEELEEWECFTKNVK